MKKILLTMMMIAFTWEVSAQESHPVIIPGKGHIDVEQLNKKLLILKLIVKTIIFKKL